MMHRQLAPLARTATSSRRRVGLAALALAVLSSPGLARAGAQVTVCASGCDYTSIQDAVDDAVDGDVIVLEQDIGESVEVVGDVQLTIRAPWGSLRSINACNADSALYVGPDADVKLIGIGISGATEAGIINEGVARLVESWVYGNSATFGGLLNWGTLVLRDDTVISSNESTSYFAGGVNNFGGGVQTWGTGVTLVGNIGHNGGGLLNSGGVAFMRGVTFHGNSAYLGGGIHNDGGDLVLDETVFQSNYADSIGGGWSNHNVGGTVTETASAFIGNVTGSGQWVDVYDVNQ